tara:strand:+ start:349 stop:546 length:198 start_codon:yes stop_codon:yes gene_type:complete
VAEETVLVIIHHLVFQLLIEMIHKLQEQIQLIGDKMVLLDLEVVAVVVVTQDQVTKEEMADLELL